MSRMDECDEPLDKQTDFSMLDTIKQLQENQKYYHKQRQTSIYVQHRFTPVYLHSLWISQRTQNLKTH